MQLVLGHCGVSRKGACGAKSDKASDLAQLTDTWSTGIVALAKSIIRARQLKPEAHRSTVTGDWEPTCTDTTLTRGEEAALACLRSGVSHKYGWLLRPLQPAIPSTCCWCGLDAAQQTRKELCTETPPPPAGPTPPRSDGRQTVRCAESTAAAALVLWRTWLTSRA
ncbi:hypothetical protein C3747_174g7 [Trypanosoma cruzi]|uniref:Uncharacterized protein n=1 Tax=Trypanosoma cruzi TaxID=5693 RepID=A0A2V2W7A9_TRYCR|nr:hypothetical protein TcYC6_0106290 [Trypanosoma cruzi]PWV03571.1 hypothetical protein C3747_174g2 [Trypanosoma cruzi]PWV03573.1 hypothetical protein C3747_174g7 [Trypanosoma cruzi]RNC36823.1 Tbingi protein [Trypanosoma cruzi]